MKIAGESQLKRRVQDLQEAIQQKQDEFLDVYSLYLETRIAWIHDELKLKAYELQMLDPQFQYRF